MLPPEFVDRYSARPVPWGYGTYSDIVYRRTYARDDEDWSRTCQRVIEGMYEMQRRHATDWDEDHARRSAMEAYDYLWNMKWTPPGRGLWMMGTPFVMNRGVVEGLNNCAFISTEFITTEKGDIFRWFMEMLMLGVGVGFDTRGEYKFVVKNPSKIITRIVVVQDTRESWAESMESLVNSYIDGTEEIQFDYSKIRAAGEPIRGFGGVSSGYKPLEQLHIDARAVLDKNVGRPLSSRTLVDLFNLIGRCVIAGNVRRSAEIALGRADDTEFIGLKDYARNPDRASYGWTSNNSIILDSSPPSAAVNSLVASGEPGFIFTRNISKYALFGQDKYDNAVGVNPCGEQPLAHREMCTLAEIYMPRIGNLDEFKRVIKSAYLYGKTITLSASEISDGISRNIMSQNRRIGLSVTGVAQFLETHGYETAKMWLDEGYRQVQDYDAIYSNWLQVPQSIRTTTVKPSGTVSLLAGVTPGAHYRTARYMLRRMRIADNSPLLPELEAAGYHIEPDVVSAGTAVVEFPLDTGARGEEEISTEEQLNLAAMLQRHWSDNAVSITVKFDEDTTTEKLGEYINWARENLKTVSFLPRDGGDYEQLPEQRIDYNEYMGYVSSLRRSVSGLHIQHVEHDLNDQYCDGDTCEVQTVT